MSVTRFTHDGPTSLATYLSVDEGARWGMCVHLCRKDSAFAICGLPVREHSHGAGGILCPECQAARMSTVVAAAVAEHDSKEPK